MLKPLNTQTLISARSFLKKIQHSKMHFVSIQDLYQDKAHILKKKVIFDSKVFKMQRFTGVTLNVGEKRPIF